MRRTLATIALAACVSSGCGTDADSPVGNSSVRVETRSVPVSHDLVEQLPVARVHWLEGWKRPRPSADKRGTTIEQKQGSSVTYHYRLPDQPVLHGTAIWSSSREVPVPDRSVFVELRSDDGRSAMLVEHVFEPGAPTTLSFERDLSEFAGRMVAIELRISEPRERRRHRPPQPPAMRWVELRLESSETLPVIAEAPADLRRPRNILLVLFDTLRADRTALYGATNVETPALERLAARGVTFTRAHSNATWTTPSVASMLTGLRAAAHRIDGTGWEVGKALQHRKYVTRLASNLPYLPELLGRVGYYTHAVVTNHMIHSAFGFARGFDRMIEYASDSRRAELDSPGPEKLAEYVWKQNLEPFVTHLDRPFFAYLHELDPHYPYLPPADYARRYDDVEGDPPEQPPDIFYRFGSDPSLLDEREIEHLEALYRGEIAFMDAYLDALLGRFEQAGLLDDTIVAFVSDHGEAFNEHGRLGHSDEIYQTLLRVPAVLVVPGVIEPGSRSDVSMSLVDLTPTLLDLTGVPIPDPMQGRSLLPHLLAERTPPEPWPVFARARFGRVWYDAVVLGRWKLVLDTRISRRGVRDLRLYDLERDPGETEDCSAAHPIVTGTLEQMLRRQIRSDESLQIEKQDVDIDSLDPQTRRQLEALGYFEPADAAR